MKLSQKKNIMFFFGFSIIFSSCVFGQFDSLFHDGLWRTYLTHLPPQYDDNENIKYPLVLVIHGGFGNAYNIEEQSQFSIKADTAAIPFIVVYPEGITSPLGISSWNAGECCGYASTNNIDDIGFISSLLDTLENKYLIDSNKIYASGMSNGGMMSYSLAAQVSNRIAAIAPVASTMVYSNILQTDRPMPIIHFHSFLDSSVPIEGGIGDGVTEYDFPSLDSVLNVWADLNGCADSSTIFNKAGEYLYKVWQPCKGNARIDLYVTYDGGHSWPGGTAPRFQADPPSEKLNATNLIWDFFLNHSLDLSTSVNENQNAFGIFQLSQNYPNPFNPTTTIEYNIPPTFTKDNFAIQLTIYNVLGKKIQEFVKQNQDGGKHKIEFDGTNFPSGIYFYKLRCGDFIQIKKMVLLK